MNEYKTDEQARRDALEIFMGGVDSVGGAQSVERFLRRQPLRQDTHLLAIGKAAANMSAGALRTCGDYIVDGLVITKHGHLHPRCLLYTSDAADE